MLLAEVEAFSKMSISICECRTELLNHEEDISRKFESLEISVANGQAEETWEEMLRREFSHHKQGVARLNNGSFGSCPASVLAAQAAWQKLWLEQPDEFYFGPLEEGLQASRAAIASMIHAPNLEEIVLVDNVTTAAAMIAQDVAWGFAEGRYQRGDAILMLNCAYGAVKRSFEAYAVRAGASVIEVEISLPVFSNQEIIDSFAKALERARESSTSVRLAIIDHITSMPSVVLPVKQLVKLCRAAGVEQVFVDGAHSLGNISFNVEEIDADYYSSNLHKWFFTPPTVAFFHCKSKHLHRLHHPVVSHNYNQGLFSECAWVGTRDYSPQLAVTSALKFINKAVGGLSALVTLNHEAVLQMGEMLATAWGTQCGTAPELSSAMTMVGLPSKLNICSHEDALDFRTKLRTEFGVEVPIHFQEDPFGEGKGTAYARVSHQIYNEVEEYLKLRDAVNSLVAEAE